MLADYVLPVKANQKQTYQDIQHLFEHHCPPKTDVDREAYQARMFETLHKAFHFFAAHPTDALKIIQKTESDN